MLILTRRVGEAVVVGRRITISVVGVKGNQVRLGIDAPRDISVHREEVSDRIVHDDLTPDGARQATAVPTD